MNPSDSMTSPVHESGLSRLASDTKTRAKTYFRPDQATILPSSVWVNISAREPSPDSYVRVAHFPSLRRADGLLSDGFETPA